MAHAIEVYERVHEVFNLPRTEAKQVARELEAHTGIVVETGHGAFEFSHLSIQEYLCASFLVRSASPELILRALSEHIAAVAIAVALSSQPSEWLARLIMNPNHRLWLERAGVEPFLSRLLIERPFFEAYGPLGWAAMFLCHRLYMSGGVLPEVAVQFVHLPGVRRSIREALRWYGIGGTQDIGAVVWLKRYENATEAYGIPCPAQVAVPRQVLVRIATEHPDTKVSIEVVGKWREMDLQSVLADTFRAAHE